MEVKAEEEFAVEDLVEAEAKEEEDQEETKVEEREEDPKGNAGTEPVELWIGLSDPLAKSTQQGPLSPSRC